MVNLLTKPFAHIMVALCLLFWSETSFAQVRKFGLGVIIGEPTGISAKLWTSNSNALDFGLGWSFVDNRYYGGSRVHLHVDYLWHAWNAIESSESLPLYYGVGGRFTGWENSWNNQYYDSRGSLALRGVFGIAWLPRETLIDVFLEIAPSLRLTPSSGFALDAALGARYYF